VERISQPDGEHGGRRLPRTKDQADALSAVALAAIGRSDVVDFPEPRRDVLLGSNVKQQTCRKAKHRTIFTTGRRKTKA